MIATDEKLNTFEEITSYNNFYEFGTGKDDPARYAGRLKTSPWTVKVDGSVQQAGRLSPRGSDQADRSSRSASTGFRCVEAWSMVIPWVGIPLSGSHQARRADGEGDVRRVHDAAAADRDAGPADRRASSWPYIEGLRMDEAMHPLTILAVGLYGKTLPNQNGAPLRLVVPWKYGFKSIKSIVRIRFVDKQPTTTWNDATPERVRLLLERESRGRSPALEPGDASGASASFFTQRRR